MHPADRYGSDVLAGDWRVTKRIPVVATELDVVVEEATSGYCGAVVAADRATVTLEDRHGRRRVFPLVPAGFLLEGRLVTLASPERPTSPAAPRRTASGSIAVADTPARVARASRVYVEGVHDAALIERVWGDDLRVEGVVVQPLHGIDDLPAVVAQFAPGPTRRLGVLVDHLVPGSKESRLVAAVRHPHVLVTGHPYVDVWQAVRASALGIDAWPGVPRGVPWKEGVARALGTDVDQMWRRVLAAVNSYTDLDTPLLRAVEELIYFVTASDDR